MRLLNPPFVHPMFVCQNCNLVLESEASRCPKCNANLDIGSVWRPLKPWKPNAFSSGDRFFAAVFCVIGVAYAGYSLHTGSFYLPSRRGGGATLRGFSAYVMSAAVLVGVAHLASMIVDHYDRRNNEERYASFATNTKYGFYGLFVASILSACVQ